MLMIVIVMMVRRTHSFLLPPPGVYLGRGSCVLGKFCLKFVQKYGPEVQTLADPGGGDQSMTGGEGRGREGMPHAPFQSYAVANMATLLFEATCENDKNI